MDEPIRKNGEVWCVVIGFDRDWEGDMGKKWWEYICSLGGKMSITGGRGAKL
jgi:hypothetical protein